MADNIFEEGKVYEDDIGTEIILDTEIDLTLASSVSIKARKGLDGIEATWAGTKYLNNYVKHEIVVGEISAGRFYLQTYAEFAGGKHWRGETFILPVYEKFK